MWLGRRGHMVQYSQRHTMINHCDRHITHLGDLDISFVLLIRYIFKISFTIRVLLTITQWQQAYIRISKQIKQNKSYISITKKSDTSLTLIYHAMSLTVLQLDLLLPVQSAPITAKAESLTCLWRGVLDTTLCDEICQ